MDSAKRILIYRLGSLGDTVVALPCFRFIRRSFPAAHITILTNHPVAAKAPPLASVLGDSGLLDALIDYPVELRSLRELFALRDRIRAGNFDLAIHLTAARGLWNSIRDYLFFSWCGISKVIGLPFRDVGFHSGKIASGFHEAESVRLARRLRPLGDVDLTDSSLWDLQLTAKENQEAEQILSAHGIRIPFLAVSLGAKLLVKDWTPENWKKLLGALTLAHPQLSILALGAEDERQTVDAIFADWKGATANLCGITSARISAAVLAKAALFVGHDSGPMHLASAVGTAVVAIFSAHSPPGQWFPRGQNNRILLPEKLCSPCSRVDCRQINGKCILSISVDEVLQAVQQGLNENPALHSHA